MNILKIISDIKFLVYIQENDNLLEKDKYLVNIQELKVSNIYKKLYVIIPENHGYIETPKYTVVNNVVNTPKYTVVNTQKNIKVFTFERKLNIIYR